MPRAAGTARRARACQGESAPLRPPAAPLGKLSATANNGLTVAALVHELGGGWESVASSILTLAVPAARSAEFLRRMPIWRRCSGR